MDIRDAQNEVENWVIDTFSNDILNDRKERCQRFLEESLEFVQAAGMTRGEAEQILEYVYSRPVEPVISTEAGGAFTTLSALASCMNVDLEHAYRADSGKRWDNQDKIRAKQNMKADKGVGGRVTIPTR